MIQRNIEETLAGVTAECRRTHPNLLDVDVVLMEEFVDEFPILGRNTLGELVPGETLAFTLVFGRDDDVHAIGLAANVIIDPAQLLFELVGAKRDTPQHPESAGVGHRGHNVATMTEGEQREFDA